MDEMGGERRASTPGASTEGERAERAKGAAYGARRRRSPGRVAKVQRWSDRAENEEWEARTW